MALRRCVALLETYTGTVRLPKVKLLTAAEVQDLATWDPKTTSWRATPAGGYTALVKRAVAEIRVWRKG
jgi:hypothetical protein